MDLGRKGVLTGSLVLKKGCRDAEMSISSTHLLRSNFSLLAVPLRINVKPSPFQALYLIKSNEGSTSSLSLSL
jgi:hypothetical protein